MSNWIDDGSGNKWHKCKLGADCGLHVVRPGKTQCWCQDQEASRVEVQVAREEIAKLEDDNERMRELVSTLGAPNHLGVPVEQWKTLREDKARLDWLLTYEGRTWFCQKLDSGEWIESMGDVRGFIDAAMGVKP